MNSDSFHDDVPFQLILNFYTNTMYPINYTIVDIKRFISTYKTIKKK